jgi:hypothetical protein
MTKYIITAKDKTLISRPRRMWIFDNKKECQKYMELLSFNKDWSLPSIFEVDEVIYKEKYLR